MENDSGCLLCTLCRASSDIKLLRQELPGLYCKLPLARDWVPYPPSYTSSRGIASLGALVSTCVKKK